jgi:hypothetical protein
MREFISSANNVGHTIAVEVALIGAPLFEEAMTLRVRVGAFPVLL